MGLYESRGNIHKAMKDLVLKWQAAKMSWDDEQARTLEREVLEPLERDVRSAGEAMDVMKALVSSARRDCQQD